MSDESGPNRGSDGPPEPPPAPSARPDPQLITYIEERDDAQSATGTEDDD